MNLEYLSRLSFSIPSVIRVHLLWSTRKNFLSCRPPFKLSFKAKEDLKLFREAELLRNNSKGYQPRAFLN